MKRKFLWLLAAGFVVALLTLAACTGPQGPEGPAGLAGPAGPQGEPAPVPVAPTPEEREAEYPYGKVRAVGFRTGDLDVYPDDHVWLTLTGGYGTHNNNNIVTSGLNNVGVGTYVYLEGKETDAHGETIHGWTWKVTGPLEQEVTVDNPTARQTRFLAAKEGKYEVQITATLTGATEDTSEFTVYAGRYVGAESCAQCHNGSVMPDKVTAWRETGHATKFETTFARYSATSDYCVGCHTTGYNEADSAGGFDDAARLAGWDPATNSFAAWMTGNSMTLQDVKDSPIGKFINIQCETCHGPGSVHTKALSFEPGVCSQCHPQEAQWRFSGHANTGSTNMHMAESTGCVECHTGQGFVEVKIRGNDPVFPKMATEDNPTNLPEPGATSPVACATCHDPHAATEPFNKGTEEAPNIASLQLRLAGEVTMPNGATVNAHESAVCVSCHANKRDLAYKDDYMARKNSRGPHGNTQSDNFYGITPAAFDFGMGNYSSSPHPALVPESCISCHMAASPAAPEGAVVDGVEVVSSHGVSVLNNAGSHTWSMTGSYLGEEVENVAACMASGCHAEGSITTFNRQAYGDFDGDGRVEGVQDEMAGLLEVVAGALPKNADGNLYGIGFNKADLTDTELQAYWNYNLVASDGSGGVHNTTYSIQVLQRTYKALTGNSVPGAALK